MEREERVECHVSLSRTVDQANWIQREAEKKHVVIVGTSFIGT